MTSGMFLDFSKAQQRWIKRCRAGEPVRYGVIIELELWRFFTFVQLKPEKNRGATQHIAVAEIGVDDIDRDALAADIQRRYSHTNTQAKNSNLRRMGLLP